MNFTELNLFCLNLFQRLIKINCNEVRPISRARIPFANVSYAVGAPSHCERLRTK